MARGSAIILGNMRPVSSPRCVFSDEHMALYVTWLQQTCKLNVDINNAPFPNAREFNAFIREQGNRYPQARPHCQHPRHPNDQSAEKYCPVCSFKIHTNYIRFIDVAWERKGGPWKLMDGDEEYRRIKQAHHFARTEFANHMDRVDGLAEQERLWDAQNPQQDTSAIQSYCSVQQMYREWLDLASTAPEAKHQRSKRVTWSDGTQEYTRRTDEMEWEYNA